MENLKKGDLVEFTVKDRNYAVNTILGGRYYVESKNGEDFVKINIPLVVFRKDIKKIGESQMQYEESNRYKLAQEIKKTGISAKALSRAVAGNESYFYNKTGVARFNKKGDISNEAFNLALTDLAFAEREVIGIGAKTVEEPSDAEIQMLDLAGSVKEKPTSNKPLFIGVAIVISIALILFILNNSQVV